MRALGVIEIKGSSVGLRTYQSLATKLTTSGLKGAHQVEIGKALSTSKAHLDGALATLNGKQAFAKDNPHKCVLVMLPSNSADDYAALKWWADTQVGINTICIIADKFKELGKPGFQANLALKFNMKSGGTNHTLPAAEVGMLHEKGRTMVVGADVSHPGQTAVQHCPSIAALVASTDGYAVNYPGYLRLQRSKQEEIADMRVMLVEALRAWYKKNSELPANILFYRDGVSDSQFAMVKNRELVSIREACDEAGQNIGDVDYKPKITLIVCGKRHHTRFFPSETNTDENAYVSRLTSTREQRANSYSRPSTARATSSPASSPTIPRSVTRTTSTFTSSLTRPSRAQLVLATTSSLRTA
jgi:hypothetical protein